MLPEILLQKLGHGGIERPRGGFVGQHALAGRLEDDDPRRGVRDDFLVEVELFHQLPLRQLALGDVARNAHDADDFPGAVEPRHLRAGHPGDAPVLPHFPLLLGNHWHAGADDFLFVLKRGPGVRLVEEVKIRLAGQFIRGCHAKLAGHGLAAFDKAGLGVLEINFVRRIIQQRLPQIPLAGQIGLHPLAFGDVKLNALRAHDLAVRTEHRRFHHVQMPFAAIGGEIDFLDMNRLAGAQDFFVVFASVTEQLEDFRILRAVRRFLLLKFLRRPANELVRLQAVELAEPGVDKDVAARAVLAEDAGGHLVNKRMIKRLRFTHRQFRLLAGGDVPECDQRRPAPPVDDLTGGDFHGEPVAIFFAMPAERNMDVSRINMVAGFFRLGGNILRPHLEKLLPAVTVEPLRGLVGVHIAMGLAVHQDDGVGRQLKKLPVTLLALAQRLLRLFPLRQFMPGRRIQPRVFDGNRGKPRELVQLPDGIRAKGPVQLLFMGQPQHAHKARLRHQRRRHD